MNKILPGLTNLLFRFTPKPFIHTPTCPAGDFLVLIKTSRNHQKRRDLFRHFYFQQKISFLFIIGKNDEKTKDDVDEEKNYFDDFIEADFIDSYQNLIYKTYYSYKYIIGK